MEVLVPIHACCWVVFLSLIIVAAARGAGSSASPSLPLPPLPRRLGAGRGGGRRAGLSCRAGPAARRHVPPWGAHRRAHFNTRAPRRTASSATTRSGRRYIRGWLTHLPVPVPDHRGVLAIRQLLLPHRLAAVVVGRSHGQLPDDELRAGGGRVLRGGAEAVPGLRAVPERPDPQHRQVPPPRRRQVRRRRLDRRRRRRLSQGAQPRDAPRGPRAVRGARAGPGDAAGGVPRGDEVARRRDQPQGALRPQAPHGPRRRDARAAAQGARRDRGYVECEQPNAATTKFTGKVHVEGRRRSPSPSPTSSSAPPPSATPTTSSGSSSTRARTQR